MAQALAPPRPAHAARGFALVALLPVGLVAALILRNEFVLPESAANALLSLGLLFTLLAFALVYLNALPATTSFMVKLVAIALAFFLGTLGAVGQAITPAFLTGYHNPNFIAEPQTLRFTPNGLGGYGIRQAPYRFEVDLGARLAYQDQREITFQPGFIISLLRRELVRDHRFPEWAGRFWAGPRYR